MCLALVHELRGEDTAVVDELAVLVFLFVQHAEFVAVANIEREVDVPAEDLVAPSVMIVSADMPASCPAANNDEVIRARRPTISVSSGFSM